MKELKHPEFPKNINKKKLPEEVARYIFDLEEYAENIELRGRYYKKMVEMICTEIEEGGFSTPTKSEDARAVREWGVGV